jgi:hypothetical protein
MDEDQFPFGPTAGVDTPENPMMVFSVGQAIGAAALMIGLEVLQAATAAKKAKIEQQRINNEKFKNELDALKNDPKSNYHCWTQNQKDQIAALEKELNKYDQLYGPKDKINPLKAQLNKLKYDLEQTEKTFTDAARGNISSPGGSSVRGVSIGSGSTTGSSDPDFYDKVAGKLNKLRMSKLGMAARGLGGALAVLGILGPVNDWLETSAKLRQLEEEAKNNPKNPNDPYCSQTNQINLQQFLNSEFVDPEFVLLDT